MQMTAGLGIVSLVLIGLVVGAVVVAVLVGRRD